MDSVEWDARYAAEELLWSSEPNRFLVEELAALPPGRALDLACGEGRNSIWLALRGFEVTGVDFSGVALEKAARLAKERGVTLQLIKADLLEWVPGKENFDLVVIMYLHLRPADRRRVIRRAAKALAPSGTLFVVGHDSRNLRDGVGGPQDPEVLFTPQDVVDDVKTLGGGPLKLVKAARAEREVEVPQGAPRSAIDALVRLERDALG